MFKYRYPSRIRNSTKCRIFILCILPYAPKPGGVKHKALSLNWIILTQGRHGPRRQQPVAQSWSQVASAEKSYIESETISAWSVPRRTYLRTRLEVLYGAGTYIVDSDNTTFRSRFVPQRRSNFLGFVGDR